MRVPGGRLCATSPAGRGAASIFHFATDDSGHDLMVDHARIPQVQPEPPHGGSHAWLGNIKPLHIFLPKLRLPTKQSLSLSGSGKWRYTGTPMEPEPAISEVAIPDTKQPLAFPREAV